MQLDLFSPISEVVDLSDKANKLLFAINDGMQKRHRYEPKLYMQFNDFVILGACNKQNEYIFNVIDLDGNTPEGFSVCWRNGSHIKTDLIEHLTKQGTLIN